MDKETIKQDIKRYFNLFKDENVNRFSTIWGKSFSQEQRLLECYEYSVPFFRWHEQLNNIKDFEDIMAELLTDIRSSFILACIAAYRPGIMCLRSILEATLRFVYYYHHPIEYNWWKNDSHEVSFKELVDYIQKVDTFKMLIKYKADMIEEMRKEYRDLSKFIHASNIHHTQSQGKFELPKFNKANFGKWQTHYIRTLSLCNLILIGYFTNELMSFSIESKESILLNTKPELRLHLGIS